MTNPFYTPSGTPGTGSKGASAPVRSEFTSIATGFAAIPALIGTCVLFTLKGADMNSTSDQQFQANLWAGGNYRIDEILAYNNASAIPASAIGGIYIGTSKTGLVIVPAAETYSSITGPSLIKVLDFSPGASLTRYNSAPYLSLSTPQGATSSLDFAIIGVLLP